MWIHVAISLRLPFYFLHHTYSWLPAIPLNCFFHFLFCYQGVKPASYNKVVDPEIKEIIGECICQKKEERWVTVPASRPQGPQGALLSLRTLPHLPTSYHPSDDSRGSQQHCNLPSRIIIGLIRRRKYPLEPPLWQVFILRLLCAVLSVLVLAANKRRVLLDKGLSCSYGCVQTETLKTLVPSGVCFSARAWHNYWVTLYIQTLTFVSWIYI